MGKLFPGKIPEWSQDKIVWKKWRHGSCHKREMLHTSTGIPRSNTCLSNSRLENCPKQVCKISDFKLVFSIEERAVAMHAQLQERLYMLSLRQHIIPEII